MKKLHLLAVLFAASAIFFTSCDPEPLGPDVVLISDAGFVSTDASLGAGEPFSVRVSAGQGNAELNLFTVKADGVNLGLTEFLVDGVSPGGNPAILFDAERLSFSKDVTLSAQSEDGAVLYSFEVTDADGNVSSADITITVGGETGGGTDPNEPPTFEATGSSNVDVEGGTLYSTTISAFPAGDAKLAQIAVYQDGTLIDASRCSLGSTDFDANEFNLPEAYQDGIDSEMLFIRVHDSGSALYRIEIIDEWGNFNSIEKTLNAGSAGTPVDLLTGVLLNAAGPAGTGGLDLNTGVGTGSADASADIKDEGIDGGPIDTNWKQQISGTNGSTVKYLVAGQNGLAEGFTFGGVDSKETVTAIFDNGVDFSGGVSNEVVVGDMFSVRNSAGETFALLVTAVSTTTDNNSDSYTFDIKF